MKPRLLVLVAIVAFVAAVAGVFLGRHFLPHPVAGGVELHDVLHSKLDLQLQHMQQLQDYRVMYLRQVILRWQKLLKHYLMVQTILQLMELMMMQIELQLKLAIAKELV